MNNTVKILIEAYFNNANKFDINGISTLLGLFYTKKLGNYIHIYSFCVVAPQEVFYFTHSPIE